MANKVISILKNHNIFEGIFKIRNSVNRFNPNTRLLYPISVKFSKLVFQLFLIFKLSSLFKAKTQSQSMKRVRQWPGKMFSPNKKSQGEIEGTGVC